LEVVNLAFCPKLQASVFLTLAECRRVRKLDLSDTSVEDAHIALLAPKLIALTELRIGQTRCSAASVELIAEHTQALRALSIRDTQATGPNVVKLSWLEHLGTLDLSGCSTTTATLRHLIGSARDALLDLRLDRVESASDLVVLEALLVATRLRRLSIQNVSSLTGSFVYDLAHALLHGAIAALVSEEHHGRADVAERAFLAHEQAREFQLTTERGGRELIAFVGSAEHQPFHVVSEGPVAPHLSVLHLAGCHSFYRESERILRYLLPRVEVVEAGNRNDDLMKEFW